MGCYVINKWLKQQRNHIFTTIFFSYSHYIFTLCLYYFGFYVNIYFFFVNPWLSPKLSTMAVQITQHNVLFATKPTKKIFVLSHKFVIDIIVIIVSVLPPLWISSSQSYVEKAAILHVVLFLIYHSLEY